MGPVLEYITKETPKALKVAKGTYKGLSPLARHVLTALLTALGMIATAQIDTGVIPNSPAALGERLATIEAVQTEQGKDISIIKNYLIRKGH